MLAQEWGIAHLSTGDLLRSAAAEGTPIGREADGHIRAGRLVPDPLVLELLRERLARPDAAVGFILDGFPRNRAQAQELELLTPLDAVVWFAVDRSELIARLAGRRTCPTCGSVYNVVSKPPSRAGVCDRDGMPLLQRPDDRPEAVEVRLKVFADQTAPLLEHYRQNGLLRSLQADGPPGTVTDRLRAALR